MKTISFKVSDDEAGNIRRQAKTEGVSVSEFLRRRAIGPVAASGVTKVICEFTGAEIFAPISHAPALTVAATREMLAEFP